MADLDDRMNLDAGIDLVYEARKILEKKQLRISLETKRELEGQLLESLSLRPLLGNYATRTTVLGIAFVTTAILLLVLLVDSTPAWAYILYGVIGGLVIAGFALLGLVIMHSKVTLRRKELISFLITRMAFWTRERLNTERSLNRRRFLFENLMNCLFDYRYFEPSTSHLNQALHETVSEIVNDPRNLDCIHLIYYLYKEVFRGRQLEYDERGFLVLMKILQPVIYYSKNDNLNNAIYQVTNTFVSQTGLNFFVAELKVMNLDPQEKIEINKKNLKTFKPEFELFSDVWFVSSRFVVKGSLKRTARNVPDRQSLMSSALYELLQAIPTNQMNPVNEFRSGFISDSFIDSNDPNSNLKILNPNDSRSYRADLEDDPSQPSITFVNLNNRGENNNQMPISDSGIDNRSQPHVIGNDFNPGQLSTTQEEHNGVNNSFQHSRLIQSHFIEHTRNSQNQSLTRIQEIKMVEQPPTLNPAQDELIKNLLDILQESDTLYKQMVKNEKMTILRKTEEGNPVVLVRARANVSGSAEKVFKLIYDLNYRAKWDRVFSNFKIVKILNQNIDLMYTYLKAPMFVTDRDFLQKRVYCRNFNGIDYIIAFRSVEDPDVPQLKNVIRAHTFISGYIITSTGPNSCSLSLVSQTDIKGYIPKSLINAGAAKAPLDWIKRLEAGMNLFN